MEQLPIFLFLSILSISLVPCLTTPVDIINPPGNPQLRPPPNSDSSNEITLPENINNLLCWLATHSDIRYNRATLLEIHLNVDDQLIVPTHSNNIHDFRRIECIFRTGGPRTPRDHFTIVNQWPHHWDEWQPPEHQTFPHVLQPIDFEQVRRRMSVDWAEYVLKSKSAEHRFYDTVSLFKLPETEVGWCFSGVVREVGEGSGVSLLVEVDGHIREVGHC
ncbi:MAG: hypothetical protein Q9170_003022 [Blastenia crenularia]